MENQALRKKSVGLTLYLDLVGAGLTKSLDGHDESRWAFFSPKKVNNDGFADFCARAGLSCDLQGGIWDDSGPLM
jgi:hypothetical protein